MAWLIGLCSFIVVRGSFIGTFFVFIFMIQPDELLQLMKDRRSIRKFRDDPVPESSIQKILEAARWCQSASNHQPWRFIVIRNKDLNTRLSQFATYGKFLKQVPVSICIVADKGTAPNWYIHDSSMTSHQMCLMIWALGLGTCWLGSFDRDKAATLLKLKKNEHITTILPIGFPDEHPNPTSRKELKDLVEYCN
jgi:nitroreductase